MACPAASADALVMAICMSERSPAAAAQRRRDDLAKHGRGVPEPGGT